MTNTELTVRIFHNFFLAARGKLSIEDIRQLYYNWGKYFEWIDTQALDFESDFCFNNENEIVYHLRNLREHAPVLLASAHLGNMRKGIERTAAYFPVSLIVDQEFYSRNHDEKKPYGEFYNKLGIEYILAENLSVLKAIKHACEAKRIIFVCIDGNRGYNRDGKGIVKIPFLGRYYLARKGCFEIAHR